MNNNSNFQKALVSSPGRSSRNLSFEMVTTSDFGKCIPVICKEMVPGDHFDTDISVFARLQSMPTATFANARLELHSFFVPNRIIWDESNEFFALNPDGSTSVIPPYYPMYNLQNVLQTEQTTTSGTTTAKPYERGTFTDLWTNLGLGSLVPQDSTYQGSPNTPISALPFRAYRQIWWDWFRDSQLVPDSLKDSYLNTSSGQQIADPSGPSAELFALMRFNRCYDKDYFTSARLHPQDGSEQSIVANASFNGMSPVEVYNTNAVFATDGNPVVNTNASKATLNLNKVSYGFTVNALRLANAAQRILEKNNIAGGRLIERLLARFGVQPSSVRMNRAEFLGSREFNIDFQTQTATGMSSSASTTGSTSFFNPVQATTGKVGGSDHVSYRAEEHGFFITILSIMPYVGYFQGIDRMWTRMNPYDYYTPEMAATGYQAITNKELWFPRNGHDAAEWYDPDGVFGYQARYAEYSFSRDVLGGDYARESSSTGANSYHLFREFNPDEDNQIALTEKFVTCNTVPSLTQGSETTLDRIFTSPYRGVYDHFNINMHVNIKASRPMVPTLLPSLAEDSHDHHDKTNIGYGGIRM